MHPTVNLKSIISTTISYLSKLSKKNLIEAIEYMKNAYLNLELRTKKLEEENQSLRSEIALLKKTDLSNKLKTVNEQSNKPSSKQADWEEKGVGNDGKGKKLGEI